MIFTRHMILQIVQNNNTQQVLWPHRTTTARVFLTKLKNTTLLHCFNHVWALSWNSDRDLLFLTNIAGTQAKRFSAFVVFCAGCFELAARALMTEAELRVISIN